MECPECHQTLHNSARYCGCGWKRDNHFNVAEPVVECAHFNCAIPAKMKIKTKTGYTNLCPHHYDQHYRDEALANLDRYGLARMPDETTAEHTARMRAFFKKGFKSFKNKTLDEKIRANADLNALVDEFTTDAGMQP